MAVDEEAHRRVVSPCGYLAIGAQVTKIRGFTLDGIWLASFSTGWLLVKYAGRSSRPLS